ncbi:MAG: aspartyl/glutamyl-tRNA amidotransferase subunit A, partial [uncultured bacterium]
LLAMGSSLDCIGAIAKTVEDAAAVMEVIAGQDKKDATTAAVPVENYQEELRKGAYGLKIGIAPELFPKGIDTKVEELVRSAIEVLQKHGAKFEEIRLPLAKYASAVYAIICTTEVSTNLARYDGIRYGYSVIADKTKKDQPKDLFEVYTKSRKYGFGDEAKRRIMVGTYALSSGYYDRYYLKASKVRTLIKKDFENALVDVDLVIGPTVPSVAQKIGKAANNPIFGYLSDELISPSSVSGLPGISVPCGFAKPSDGDKELPVGMQIVGKPFGEDKVLRAAFAYEQAMKNA